MQPEFIVNIGYFQLFRLADAADVVRVFHIVYPNSNSAIVASKNKNLSDEQLLQVR